MPVQCLFSLYPAPMPGGRGDEKPTPKSPVGEGWDGGKLGSIQPQNMVCWPAGDERKPDDRQREGHTRWP